MLAEQKKTVHFYIFEISELNRSLFAPTGALFVIVSYYIYTTANVYYNKNSGGRFSDPKPLQLPHLGDQLLPYALPQLWHFCEFLHWWPKINNDCIQGDRTENVLWRLQNGELDNLSPKVTIFCIFSLGCEKPLPQKVIVVSAGQNNQGDSPEQIAEGVKEICAVIRSKQPQAFLVLLVSFSFVWNLQTLNVQISIFLPQTLLPRGQLPNPLRERNAKVGFEIRGEVAGGENSSRMKLGYFGGWYCQYNLDEVNADMIWMMSMLSGKFVVGRACKGKQSTPACQHWHRVCPGVNFILLSRCQLLSCYPFNSCPPGWPEHLPSRHVGLSWAHPEGLQQGIRTGQRAPHTGVNTLAEKWSKIRL